MCLYLLPQILLPRQGQNTPGEKKTKTFIPKKSSYQIFSWEGEKVLLVDNSCFLRNGVFPKGMSILRILWCYGKKSPISILSLPPDIPAAPPAQGNCSWVENLPEKGPEVPLHLLSRDLPEEIHQLKRENIQISPQLLWWRKMSSLEPLKDE